VAQTASCAEDYRPIPGQVLQIKRILLISYNLRLRILKIIKTKTKKCNKI